MGDELDDFAQKFPDLGAAEAADGGAVTRFPALNDAGEIDGAPLPVDSLIAENAAEPMEAAPTGAAPAPAPAPRLSSDFFKNDTRDASGPAAPAPAPKPEPALPAEEAPLSIQSASDAFTRDTPLPKAAADARAAQRSLIAEREAQDAKAHEEALEKAREAIDNFYTEYNESVKKTVAQNKADEEVGIKARSDSLAQGTFWERVVSLVDVSGQSKDVARFKEILLQLASEKEGQ